MYSEIIKASAGTGKTYQLTLRYVMLLALEVCSPDKIVALTFTKKAASEFTHRILSALCEAASSDKKATALTQQLQALLKDLTTQFPEHTQLQNIASRFEALTPLSTNAGFWLKKLERLSLALDQITLATLDSFFINYYRQIAAEKGVFDLRIVDELEVSKVSSDIITQILTSSDAPNLDEFYQAFKLSTYGKEENKLTHNLESFIANFHRIYLDYPSQSQWGVLASSELKELAQSLPNESKDSLLNHLSQAIESSLDSDWTTEKKREAWAKTWRKNLACLQNYNAEKGVRSLEKNIEDLFPQLSELFAGKAVLTYYKIELPFTPDDQQKLAHLLTLILLEEHQHNLSHSKGIAKVVEQFETQYNLQFRQTGKLTFSDITKALVQESNDLGASKIDQQYHHWLLDEFQDTSANQWEIIQPFFQDIQQSSDEKSVLVVGDKKQAIYGWRGGDAELFNETEKGWNLDNTPLSRNLSQSWRSAPQIMAFSNTLFGDGFEHLKSFTSSIFSDPNFSDEDVLKRWEYQAHESAPPLRDANGLVQVIKSPKASRADEREVRYEALFEEILSLTEEGSSYAILVKSNKQVLSVVSWLKAQLEAIKSPLIVTTNSADLLIKKTSWGHQLLSLFKWLRSPSDQASEFMVMKLDGFKNWIKETESDTWQAFQELLRQEGLVSFLETISPQSNDAHLAHHEEILKEAYALNASELKLEAWIHLLEKKTIRRSSTSNTIQVMVYHQSKGLEFDHVFLPELEDSNVDFTKQKVLESQEQDTLLIGARKSTQLGLHAFHKHTQQWLTSQTYESICTLYVAITRAKKSLTLITKYRDTPSNTSSYSAWLDRVFEERPKKEIKATQDSSFVLYTSSQGHEI